MKDTSEQSRLLSEFLDDFAKEFASRRQESLNKLFEAQKESIQRYEEFLAQQQQVRSAEFAQFAKILVAGQMHALSALREAQDQSFEMQSAVVKSYRSFLTELHEKLSEETDATTDGLG